MASVVIAAGGAAAGWAIGGTATAALYGAQIGFALAGFMGVGGGGGDQTVQGPKIGEVSTQNSKEGTPRPIIFGVCRPIGGNIIASGKPRIKVIREKVSSGGGGGKGGGGGGGGDTYQEREEVYRTYAIRISEGPVSGVRRVWRDNKLVYDSVAQMAANEFASGNPGPRIYGYTSSGANTQVKNNNEFLKVARFYLGGYDQMPDPALEAEFGVANVTAYRGTCYMVMDNEDLTPRRGSIPQYIFEVARSEGFPLTTRPYSIIEIAGLDLNPVEQDTHYNYPPVTLEGIDLGVTLTSVILRQPLKETDFEPEGLALSVDSTGVALRQLLKNYQVPVEGLSLDVGVVSVTQEVLLIDYKEWPTEGLQLGVELTGVTLS